MNNTTLKQNAKVVLLQADTQLIATEIRDYPEWHKARSDYGLWYIEIDQPELIQYLDEIQNTVF